MRKPRNIFVAATGQNVGKTTTCLGLYDKLVKSGMRMGFIKPVGQRYLNVKDVKVDEDSYLIHEIYKPDCALKPMSPIAVPAGFTQRYIDGAGHGELLDKITDAYAIVEEGCDFVLIEGTGHAGVGSVFDTSNAVVASALNSKVVLVTDGGIGRAIDNLILNKSLFDSLGVELVGVIVNKVYKEKYEKIYRYVDVGLSRLGIKLLGVIPYQKRLRNPNMEQICDVLDGEFITGKQHKMNSISNIVVGAMSVPNILKDIKKQTLVITPGDREDIILAALSWNLSETSSVNLISGLVVTSNVKPGKVVTRVMKNSNVPIIFTRHTTFLTASLVHDLKVKIKVTDSEKIALSQQLFDQYVDCDYILEHC